MLRENNELFEGDGDGLEGGEFEGAVHDAYLVYEFSGEVEDG